MLRTNAPYELRRSGTLHYSKQCNKRIISCMLNIVISNINDGRRMPIGAHANFGGTLTRFTVDLTVVGERLEGGCHDAEGVPT